MGFLEDYEADLYWNEQQLYMEHEYSARIGVWHTKDGKALKIKDMETSHIKNCIAFIRRNDKNDMYEPYIKVFEEELKRREESSVFVTSPTEVIKVGEPLSNSDEIRQAFENGEIYKRGFEDARKRYERPHGEWIVGEYMDCHSDILPKYTCPFCGEVAYRKYDYCHCGADMRGGTE